jgi:hypothetical protein
MHPIAPPNDLPPFGVALPHFPSEKRSAVAADDFGLKWRLTANRAA